MRKEFQIKEPCTVGRENMKDIPEGSFCDLCSKKVHDLTDKTDDEIHLLLQSGKSVCGRIQASRLYSNEEKSKINYNFYTFPFRKIASGIFLAALFSSNLNAQKKSSDTLRDIEILDGLIEYAYKSDGSSESEPYYRPQNIYFDVKISGNKDLLGNHDNISILTLEKRYVGSYNSKIKIREDYLSFENIFVFENEPNKTYAVNQNQYYAIVSKNKFKGDGTTVDFNFDKARKIEFKSRNKKIPYFLDGLEISKEDFERKRKENKIFSYFLSESYARQLLGEMADYEDGIMVSYTE